MAGETTLASGERLASGFVVDSANGELTGVYWKVADGQWVDAHDPETPAALRRDRDDLFPFDWDLAVPADRDSFHGDPPPHRPRLP